MAQGYVSNHERPPKYYVTQCQMVHFCKSSNLPYFSPFFFQTAGGSHQMVTLQRVLRRRMQVSFESPVKIPSTVSAIVLDSSPGKGSLRQKISAFQAAAKSQFKKITVAIIISLIWLVAQIRLFLFGTKTSQDIVQESLLHPSLLPWMDQRTPRLYIFSKGDELIPWKHVQAHTERAKAKGIDVRTEIYETSGHVLHSRADPERYWGSISKLWKYALESAAEQRGK